VSALLSMPIELERNPNVVLDLLTFRDSNAGVMLRAEVRSLLDVHAGADLVAAINGGLHRSIPTRVLQMARDTCLGVLSASGQYVTGLPSLIVDPRLSDESFSRWRVRSLAMLREYCGSRRRGSDASCPCGSGEVLRDCCEAALRL